MVGVNLGSGQRPFHDVEPDVEWINIDSQARWEPDIICDAANTDLESRSVDCVVLHHVLEHFGCGEGIGLLKEAHRILRPGGSLIVCVPNMWALAERWLQGKIDNFIFMVNCYGAYMGSEDDRHKWGFTFETLHKQLLDAAQWQDVRRFDDRAIPGADIAADWWILSLEAVK